ncbi:penicillin acylase family protein [Jiangella mangrovi]|uniref:Penicillin amidase n=1 Tax=Jiangella mangrovi TaxID=1524084 RepID=A0A7W9LJ99_9ACTN|nr:penicillin acylase family protein [Jiangella mangrovi]MBB5785833.1 penicillin amidase [Jiangella mangrovi]
MSRSRRLGLVGAAALLLVAGLLVPSQAQGTGVERYRVEGLDSPVRINVDEWGVPHIFARSSEDAFFAQGWNVARDRLFQIDLWRRRGLGQLSEVFGPDYVEQDRAARLFLYQGDMEDEWAAYGEGAEEMATRFAAGINAYIDWLEDNPEALPPEFRLLDYFPDRWAPEDAVRNRTHGLTRGVSNEVSLARGLACRGRLDLDPLRERYEPDHTTRVPEGLDPCSIPADVLDVYDLATSSVRFTGDAARPLTVEDRPDFEPGSNNWVVSADKTATGRPILANDPHRAHENPSLRYITHLSSPELDVIGAGEPGLPGISIGHNGTAAFGLTIFAVDEADLYVYELDETNERYLYQGEWEPFEVRPTEIDVRGGGTETHDLVFTRHGPVTLVDEENHRAYAVRTVWTEPGTAPYFGSSGYMNARSWDDFTDAMSRWATPGENQVYADVHGDIGWQPGGKAPVRVGFDGLLPVPGDGRYEWAGFRGIEEFPSLFNPPEGFAATANQFNAQDDSRFGYIWSDPIRKNRIDEVLAADDDHTVQESAALQSDILNIRTREIMGMAGALDPADPVTAQALEFMRGYDFREEVGSPHALLYRGYWETRINQAVKAELVAPDDLDEFGNLDWLVVEDALRDPEAWFDGGAATRDELLLTSLRDAFTAAQAGHGDDPSQWAYRGVTVGWNHRLGDLMPDWDIPSVQMPGSGGNPLASAAASFKMVLDVGRWDNSIALNVPGQSGVPGSRHYDDLVERWSTWDYFPLLYSRGAIERHTEQRIMLVPRHDRG